MNDRRTVALPFPSEWISWHRLVFPKGRHWRQALPFALEEQLASDLQQLHFIPVRDKGSKEGWVAVVSQQDWQAFATQSATAQATWYPDFMRLPWQANQVTLWQESESRWLLRWGEWEGSAGLPSVMKALLAQLTSDTPKKLLCYGEIDAAELASGWNIKVLPVSLLPNAEPSFDLRQGAGLGRWTWSGFGSWKRSLVLLGMLLVVGGASNITHTLQLQQATHELKRQTQELVSRHFPEIKRQVNLIAQAKAAVKERQALQAQLASSPLLILGVLDEQLLAFPPVSQLSVTDKAIELSWSTPLAERLLTQPQTLNGWEVRWQGSSQLRLVKQGETP